MLVAVPSRSTGTLFWTISVKTAKVGPTPSPVTNIQAHRTGIGVSTRRWESMNSPTAISPSAPTMRTRYRPVRLTIWPDATALMISPPSSGSIW